MLIIDPPATAGGTDLLQVRLLTFEAKPRRISHRLRQFVQGGTLAVRTD